MGIKPGTGLCGVSRFLSGVPALQQGEAAEKGSLPVGFPGPC